MQTKIVLIRHVETIGNVEKRLTGRKDYKLTEQGIKTVKMLTEYLKDSLINAIYASTSDRTFETVRKIAEYKNIPVQRRKNLCEMYFGIYDGWKWEEVNKENPSIKEGQDKTNEIMGIEEQETTEQVASRMYQEVLKIALENIGKTVVIASHGVAIEAFLRKVTRRKI